jgi:putative ABC transport system ATP-binding protein
MHKMQETLHTSFVFSSHDPQLIEWADDTIAIRDGEIIDVRMAS